MCVREEYVFDIILIYIVNVNFDVTYFHRQIFFGDSTVSYILLVQMFAKCQFCVHKQEGG